MKRVIWIAFGWCVLSQTTQATSFDCAKATAKVEHIICGNTEISRLDDELAQSYQRALHDQAKMEQIRLAQKQWLKVRNSCSDADCIAMAYRKRIGDLHAAAIRDGALLQTPASGTSNEEHYVQVMSKNDEMCNHILQLMNDDLQQLSKTSYGRTFDRHDAFVEGLREFNSVPWKKVNALSESSGEVHYRDAEGALLDLNNDGVLDFVVRDKSYLSGIRADLIYMLDSEAGNQASASSRKNLFNSNNQIDLVVSQYRLSDPLEWDDSRKDMLSPFAYNYVSLRLISPFVYRGVSYLYMQSLYKKDEAIGGDYVVIAKYGGGVVSGGNTNGKMEDNCYIKRVDVKQSN